MVDEIDQRWGRTDVLVHNAMTPFAITSFAELSWEQLGGKLDSELRAAFLTTKAVVPGMVSRGYGRLIYSVGEAFIPTVHAATVCPATAFARG
jgi:3-oxoacyl-[acyl-carrier protein] reductase